MRPGKLWIGPIQVHWRLLVIVFLFLAAFAIRVYRINEPPLNFHATRQYRSLIIARGFYYAALPSAPEWKRQVAGINSDRQGVLEPPIMEHLASFLYRAFGGEQYWIPRALSALFWLFSAGVLYLIAKRLMDGDAALFSTIFYLFLPFAVLASRGFQPDSLMMLLLLASLYALLRDADSPSIGRIAAAVIFSALAIYIKPISLFVIYAVLICLAVYRQGLKRSLTDLRLISFFLLTMLPTVIFYLNGILVTGALREQARSSFLPQLLIEPFYWQGWLHNIRQVVGFSAFFGALLGVMLFRKGPPRVFQISMWIGYVVFCLVFNYHIATHDYYHLQLIPIVALSLGPLASLIFRRLNVLNPDWYWRVALWMILLGALALSLNAARVQLQDNPFQAQVKIAEEIGKRVQHSTSAVFLASDYGLSLEYHGELSGEPWPLASDLEWERLAGAPVLAAAERFSAWFTKSAPEYFIVRDLREFEQQPDLRQFLTGFSLVFQSDDYIIYRLK